LEDARESRDVLSCRVPIRSQHFDLVVEHVAAKRSLNKVSHCDSHSRRVHVVVGHGDWSGRQCCDEASVDLDSERVVEDGVSLWIVFEPHLQVVGDKLAIGVITLGVRSESDRPGTNIECERSAHGVVVGVNDLVPVGTAQVSLCTHSISGGDAVRVGSIRARITRVVKDVHNQISDGLGVDRRASILARIVIVDSDLDFRGFDVHSAG